MSYAGHDLWWNYQTFHEVPKKKWTHSSSQQRLLANIHSSRCETKWKLHQKEVLLQKKNVKSIARNSGYSRYMEARCLCKQKNLQEAGWARTSEEGLEGCQETGETTAGTWRTADRKKERNYRLQKSTKSMLERLWQQQQLIMERLIKENVQAGNPFWAQADRNNIHAAGIYTMEGKQQNRPLSVPYVCCVNVLHDLRLLKSFVATTIVTTSLGFVVFSSVVAVWSLFFRVPLCVFEQRWMSQQRSNR